MGNLFVKTHPEVHALVGGLADPERENTKPCMWYDLKDLSKAPVKLNAAAIRPAGNKGTAPRDIRNQAGDEVWLSLWGGKKPIVRQS